MCTNCECSVLPGWLNKEYKSSIRVSRIKAQLIVEPSVVHQRLFILFLGIPCSYRKPSRYVRKLIAKAEFHDHHC